MLFAGLGSVCIVKNCDLGFENRAEKDLGHSKYLPRYYEIEVFTIFPNFGYFLTTLFPTLGSHVERSNISSILLFVCCFRC